MRAWTSLLTVVLTSQASLVTDYYWVYTYICKYIVNSCTVYLQKYLICTLPYIYMGTFPEVPINACISIVEHVIQVNPTWSGLNMYLVPTASSAAEVND